MATATTTLWTLATLRTWMKITDAADTSLDAKIEIVANGVTELMEQFTGWRFVSRSVVETRDGSGGRTLILDQRPVVSVASLTILASPGGTPETIASTDYTVSLDRGLIRLNSASFTSGFANVVVTYTHGFGAQGAATLPQDISLAGLDLFKLLMDRWQSGGVGQTSVTFGPNGNVQFSPEWPKNIVETLRNWRGRAAVAG